MLTRSHSEFVTIIIAKLWACGRFNLLHWPSFCLTVSKKLALSLALMSFFSTANEIQQSTLNIAIAPSSLQKALMSASEQMQITIYADFDLIKDKKVAGVSGRLSADQMLSALLKGHQLSFQTSGEGFYVIIPLKEIKSVASDPAVEKVAAATQHTDIYNLRVIGQRLWNSDNGLAHKKGWVGNNAFISKDALALSASSTISDALNILPSVIAYADMRLGQAATGESEYVSVRSMNSDYTSTYVNGIQVQGADPFSRSLSLKMIMPNSLDSVRILKTPTVEWGGEGIGGVINIVSPNGFDFGPDYLRVTSGFTYSDLSEKHGFSTPGKVTQLDLGQVWGEDDEWAFYTSAYQQQKYAAAESLEAGGYVAATLAESKLSDLRLVREGLMPTDIRFDFYHSLVERTGGNFSLDYRKGAHKLFFRGNVSRYDATGSDVQRKLVRGVEQVYDQDGLFQPQGVVASGYFQTRDYSEVLSTLQLGGDTTIHADWDLAFHVAAADSRIERPDYVESSLNGLSTPGSFTFDISNPQRLNLAFDSPSTRDYLLDPGSVRVRKFQGSDSSSRNSFYDTKLELEYQSLSVLSEIKMGIEHNQSIRTHFNRAMTGNNGANYVIPKVEGRLPQSTAPQGPTGAELAGTTIDFMRGLVPNFKVYHRDYFENTLLPLAYQDLFSPSGEPNPGRYTADDYNRNTIKGTEYNSAVYLQAKGSIASFTIVPGLRIEKSRMLVTHWDTAKEPHQFVDFSLDHAVLLPNLNISYQSDPELLFRFAARRAISRAAFAQLAEAESIEYDSLSDQVSTISRANPQLKPERAMNYDLSAEWYLSSSSLAELALYYKKIKDVIYTGSISFMPNNHKVTLTQPLNGYPAQLRGVDFHLRHQFDYLPYFWQNTGVDLSATVQHSWMQNSLVSDGVTIEMPRAPQQNYKLQVFYQSDSYLIAANWVHTGKQLLSVSDSGLDKYLQSSQRLDLSMIYKYSPFSFSVQLENLLNDVSFYKTLGRSTQYLGTQDAGGNGSFVQTGRFATFTLSFQF